jgi:hypothetical protein
MQDTDFSGLIVRSIPAFADIEPQVDQLIVRIGKGGKKTQAHVHHAAVIQDIHETARAAMLVSHQREQQKAHPPVKPQTAPQTSYRAVTAQQIMQLQQQPQRHHQQQQQHKALNHTSLSTAQQQHEVRIQALHRALKARYAGKDLDQPNAKAKTATGTSAINRTTPNTARTLTHSGKRKASSNSGQKPNDTKRSLIAPSSSSSSSSTARPRVQPSSSSAVSFSTATPTKSKVSNFFHSRPYELPTPPAKSAYNRVNGASSSGSSSTTTSAMYEPRSSGEAKAEPAYLTRSNSNMTPSEKVSMDAMQKRGLPFVESLLCLRKFNGDFGRAFGEVMEILRERADNQIADKISMESEAMNVQERAKRDKEMELRCAYTDVVSDGMFAGSVLLRDVLPLKNAVSLGDEICIVDDDDDEDDNDARTLGIKLLVMEQRTKTWFCKTSVEPFFLEFSKQLCVRLSSAGESLRAVLGKAVQELEEIIYSMPKEEGGMPTPFVEALDRSLDSKDDCDVDVRLVKPPPPTPPSGNKATAKTNGSAIKGGAGGMKNDCDNKVQVVELC